MILLVIVEVKGISAATKTEVVKGLRLVRVNRLEVMRIGPVSVLVTINILDGFVRELTFIALKISPPVRAIQTPLGLATILIVGTALALQVSVVTVRVLFI